MTNTARGEYCLSTNLFLLYLPYSTPGSALSSTYIYIYVVVYLKVIELVLYLFLKDV